MHSNAFVAFNLQMSQKYTAQMVSFRYVFAACVLMSSWELFSPFLPLNTK